MAERSDPKTNGRRVVDDHASQSQLTHRGVGSKRKSSSGESGPSKKHRTSDSSDSHRKRSVLKTMLDIDDLATLLELTRNAARQWVDIGLSLRFDKCELDEIQAHPLLIGDGVPGFFREMISRWLKRAPPNHGFPAISDLVSALQSTGEENVAYTLEHHYEGVPVHRFSLLSEGYSEEDAMESPRDKSNDDTVFSPGAESVESIDHPRVYGCECGDCTFASVLERGCPQAIVTESGLPFLDTSGLDESEKDYLIGKLLEDSRKMMYSFQKLVSRTCTSLEQRGVTPKQLVDHLIALGPLDPVLKGSEGGALHKGLSDMRKSGTVGDVFFQIRDYMSFFNYEILEHIVEELGTDDDREEVVQYKGKLRDYCRRRAVECPLSYGMPSKSGHVRIVVKLDEDVEKYTVAELKLFQRNVSGILNLKEYALCLVSVNKGCLELTFQMPSLLKQKVFPLSYKQEEALKWEGVIKLQCEEYHFPSQEQTFDRKGEDALGDGAGPSLVSNTTGGTPPPLPSQPPHQLHGHHAPPTALPSRQAGYECEFVNPPPEAFQTNCTICLNILCDPQETDCCGHNFCRTCIGRVQKEGKPSCPMCKEPVTMHPNKGLKRSLNQLQVRCTHERSGCDWVGELGELDRHLNSYPTPGELFSGCECNEIECEFSYAGCTTRIPRKDMATHIEEAQPHHIRLLTQQIKEKEKELKQTKALNTRLQERIEVVIRKSHSLENQLNELTEKKETEMEELRQALQEKEKQVQVYHLPPQPLQANHHFTLDNFEAKKTSNMVWYSKPFYTHSQGYKIRAQVYPNGTDEGKGTHVTVSMCLMRGKHDDHLPWPFRGEIAIELLNQNRDGGHLKRVIPYDESVPKGYADKISSDSFIESNEGFGYDRFISHLDLIPQGDPSVQYLKDDCLKFRVYTKSTH